LSDKKGSLDQPKNLEELALKNLETEAINLLVTVKLARWKIRIIKNWNSDIKDICQKISTIGDSLT
jgi:hypothetical protein